MSEQDNSRKQNENNGADALSTDYAVALGYDYAKQAAPKVLAKGLVERIGLSCRHFREFYGDRKINAGLAYAKDLKDRYTVLWMYDDLFR